MFQNKQRNGYRQRNARGNAIVESGAALTLFLPVFVACLFGATLVFTIITVDAKLKFICTQVALAAAQNDDYFLGLQRKEIPADRSGDALALKLALKLAAAQNVPISASDVSITHSINADGIDSATCAITFGNFKIAGIPKLFPGIRGRRVSITASSVNPQPAPAALYACAFENNGTPLTVTIPAYGGYRPSVGAVSVATNRILTNFATTSTSAGNDPGPGGLKVLHQYGLRLPDKDKFRADGPIDGDNHYESVNLEPRQPTQQFLAP